MRVESMIPRYPSARILWEMLQFHLKVEQSACIQTVVEGSDVGDDLHIHDRASFGMVGVTEYFERERCHWNLAGICLKGLVGGSVRGAVGCRAASRREPG